VRRAYLLLLLGACSSGQSSRSSDSGPDTYRRPESETRRPSTDRGLRAGEVDDNDKFDDYVRYFKAYPDRNVRKIDVTDRMVLWFADRENRPVSCSPVRILADGQEVYRAVTSAGGGLMFPPRALGVSSQVQLFEADIVGRKVAFRPGDHVQVSVDIAQAQWDSVDLDVAFCLDTTGSMGDEIDRLTSTLRSVVSRIDRLQPQPRLRLGMITFKDRRDSYITERTDLTANLDKFQWELSRTTASGGGDYEESVNEGLRRAIHDLSWRRNQAIRILFLIGDAPPHMDYSDDTPYTETMRVALERGIKIYTIAASGLNDKGEFVWRQLAQFTLAKFMFISYGGGTGHHVGSYRENNLDELMVKAIEGEVASLRLGRERRSSSSEGQGKEPTDFRQWREWRDRDR